MRLTNLKKIHIRKLRVGEHIPEFRDVAAELENLTFYRSGLPTGFIFYGDWQYDLWHRRVTTYIDEYGEMPNLPSAGPQVTCIDDVEDARKTANCKAVIERG